ncbi:hypothetical protein A4X09_0g244 [Tilletia walkeri]|uniref:Xylanolytic transcriptional activator regulatory domain-containing protein n=1 Tax=Tilletia walkeri TaxID=117179 RepID=A0A8X7NHP1_9BASI|nr:hypothetical protein A4X09_0g244 [Tilletia walkeri]
MAPHSKDSAGSSSSASRSQRIPSSSSSANWFDSISAPSSTESYDLFPFSLSSTSYPQQQPPQPPQQPRPAAVEFAAIKERLAQLEASLAHAQLQAAHNAAVAAAAGVTVDSIPSPPVVSQQSQQQSSIEPGFQIFPSAAQTTTPWHTPGQGSRLSLQPQPQQQGNAEGGGGGDSGDGVDSDTEDAAAVLEGLAMGRKKHDEGSSQKHPSALSSSSTTPTAQNTTAPTPPTSTTSPVDSSATTAVASNTTMAVLCEIKSGTESRGVEAFQRLLEADKKRDLMLPDGRESDDEQDKDGDGAKEKDAGKEDEMDVDVEVVPQEDDAGETDEEVMPASTTDHGISPSTLTSSTSTVTSPESASSPMITTTKGKKRSASSSTTVKTAPRAMSKGNASRDSISTTTAGAASSTLAPSSSTPATRDESSSAPLLTVTPSEATAAVSKALPATTTEGLPAEEGIYISARGFGPYVDAIRTMRNRAEKAGIDSVSTPTAVISEENKTDATSTSLTTATATHIRGPTAEAYDLARSHQGLFRVIVQGESMLGFGLGWPFAAAEENGDYKVIKGIGACPGNTQREAVLRAIIRTIPEREAVDQLLGVWEENVSFLAGKVIHVPTLRKEIETFFAFDSVEKRARVVSYVDPGWLAVLLMVFVTGIQFWPCNSTRSPTIFDGRSQSMWYAAAKSALVLARYQSSQSLSVLQSIILINLHAQEPGRVNTALMRIAINNAMDLRLHRLGDADKALGAQKGVHVGPCAFVRRQIELRIWWALVFRDWSSSACTGHYVINPDYFNSPLPANLNEHELCQTPTPQAHPVNVATEMSWVLANIEMAKAVRLNTDLLNRASIQSLGRSKGLRAEDEEVLDGVYRSVLAHAPVFFQAGSREGEGTNLEVQRWLFVQAVFHKLLNVHRRRISSRAESRVTCVLLARSILDMQSKLRQRCCLINRMCLNLMQSFSAASVLCLDLLQSPTKGAPGSDSTLRDAIRSEVSEALEALRSVAEENHTAQRMFRIIEALLAEEEHRWNSAGPSSSSSSSSPSASFNAGPPGPSSSYPGSSSFQQQPHLAGQKRKRSDEGLQHGGKAAQGKKELLRLARRVAEAAQEKVHDPAGGCPLAEHSARRAREVREGARAVELGGVGGNGSQVPAQQQQSMQTQTQQQQQMQQEQQQSVMGSMSGAGGNGQQGQQMQMQMGTQQYSQPQTSSAPFIFPTPALAEHPLFTDKEFASNMAPTTKPSFEAQQFSLAPNGLDLQQVPAAFPDGFGFDLDAFLASISSQSPGGSTGGGSVQQGQGQGQTDVSGMGAAAEAAAAVQWLNSAQGQGNSVSGASTGMTPDSNASGGVGGNNSGVDLFSFGNMNPLLPSPSASTPSSSAKGMNPARSQQLQQQSSNIPGGAGVFHQTLPTPPQSDSAGSSSGQSPPSSAGGAADSSNDWFWNWVLGQGAVGHARAMPEVLQNVPALQGSGQGQQTGGAGTQYSMGMSDPGQMAQPQQQQQQQQRQDPTTLVSSNFLPVPPLSSTSAPAAPAPKTPGFGLRAMPGTPSSYFSLNSFFTPGQQQQQQQNQGGGGGGEGSHASHSNSNSMGMGMGGMAGANLGTPSASLPPTSSSGAGAGATNANDGGMLGSGSGSSGAGGGEGGSAPAEMSMEEFGQWLQAPSLFDFAGDLGIAEGGMSISPQAGYLASLMLG